MGHIELKDIERQLEKSGLDAEHRRIKRSSLVEAAVFPQLVQVPEFIMTVAQFYNPDTKQCVDSIGILVIDLSPNVLALVFQIPTRREVLDEGEQDGEREQNRNMNQCKKMMNEERLEEEKKTSLKENEILRQDFKEPQRDLIIILSKAFGKPACRNFQAWMFSFMLTILDGQKYYEWAQVLSDNIKDQLRELHNTKKFFFMSYVIWVVARSGQFLGLQTKSRLGEEGGHNVAWDYYTQFPLN